MINRRNRKINRQQSESNLSKSSFTFSVVRHIKSAFYENYVIKKIIQQDFSQKVILLEHVQSKEPYSLTIIKNKAVERGWYLKNILSNMSLMKASIFHKNICQVIEYKQDLN